ncbi:hypothetical protein ACJJH9_16805 [Microbulbifer sp. DLAB2-AF]|uniref:hypothetical protein n=1 Tax=Microbulbifer sp. DLAB2-AF TaxID=3243395 RepID=UPI00403A6CC6
MHILKGGRKDFLDFLRNMTPQIIIFSLIVISGQRLDFSEVTGEGVAITFMFWIFVGIFFLAFWANTSLLIKSIAESKPEIAFEFKMLEKQFGGADLFKRKIYHVWEKDKWIFFEAVIVVFIVMFVFSMIILYGAKSGADFQALMKVGGQ